jgi:hypothetical protein
MPYPFRVERKTPLRTEDTHSDLPQQLQDYTDRLIRLIPAEIIGIYLTVRGFWMPIPTAHNSPVIASTFLYWWLPVCAVLLVLSRVWGTRAPQGNLNTIQIPAILIALVSLFIWVYSIGDAVFGWNPYPPLVSTILVIWVFLVPAVYYGNSSAPAQ